MYQKLPIPPDIPQEIQSVIRDALDLKLSDVHTMLRLPCPGVDGFEAACNFAIADTLFSVIEGASAVLTGKKGEAGPLFKAAIESYYKAEAEKVSGGKVGADLAASLWDNFRNPSQHCLGLALGAPKSGTRFPLNLPHGLRVHRDKASVTEAQLTGMETTTWPTGFLHRPTLAMDSGDAVLSIEAFYVGTRRLLANILADPKAVSDASAYLRGLLPPTVPNYQGTLSSVTAGTSVSASVTFTNSSGKP